MSIWAKKLNDGTISMGSTIYSKDYVLTEHSITEVDGWKKFQNEDEATAFFKLAEDTTPVISASQIRLWLINHNIPLENVMSAINNIEDVNLREATKIEWEYAPYVSISHPVVIQLAQMLGLSEDHVNIAFKEASLL